MVYIGTTSYDGGAAYIDVHAAERSADGLRISGTIGDGQYEGDVLVEFGRTEEVTFVDAWLGGSGYREFAARFDLDRLQKDLLASLRGMGLLGFRQDAPHIERPVRSVAGVAGPGPLWEGAA